MTRETAPRVETKMKFGNHSPERAKEVEFTMKTGEIGRK